MNAYNGALDKLFDINGKKAVIIGGAGGFGKAISEGFAANGCSVIIASRRESALREAKQQIEMVAAANTKVQYFAGDISDEETVKALLEYTVGPSGLGGCDILVNCQGFNKKMFSWEIDVETWEQMLKTNVTSVMLTCKYFGNWMKEHNTVGLDSGYGKIINLSSVRGIRAVPNGGNGNVPYNTTKGAVEMLTKAFASDLRPNIQVNAIGPTITYTPMMNGILPESEEARDRMALSQPAMRIGREIDVVGSAIFLASHASDFITGSTIYPDGGLTSIG